jgi:hypothetical protein
MSVQGQPEQKPEALFEKQTKTKRTGGCGSSGRALVALNSIPSTEKKKKI